jgi:hypothetical protein
MRLNIKKVIGYSIMIVLIVVFILIISQPPEEPTVSEVASGQEQSKELDQFEADNLELANERYQLQFDGRYGSVHITDRQTGQSWDSIPAIEETVPPNNQRYMRSPVYLRYTEGKGDTQTYPFKEQGTLTAKLIDDGKAIRANFELDNLQMAFAIEYRLNKDGLEITIPYDSIRDGVDKKLVSIEVMPFFEAAAEQDDGAMVIPDGSGALIKFKEDHPQFFYPYSQFVYGGDHAYQKHVYQKVSENEKEMLSYNPREMISLPIYGLYKKDKAFLAVIDNGEEDAKINATPSGIRNIKLYRASPEFIYRNDDNIFLGNSGEIPMTLSTMIPGDRSVRFILLQGEQANYSGMAKAYRNYLIAEEGIEPVEDQEMKYQLRLFGGVLQDEIIGSTFVSMTTFEQAKTIIDQLLDKGIHSLEVTMEGWSDEGKFGDQPDHFPADRKLGGTEGLRNLSEYAQSKGVDLYITTNYVKPFKKSDALRKSRDVIRGLNKEILEVYKPYVTTRQASRELYYFMRPGTVYDRYITEEAPMFSELGLTGVQLNYMGNTLYSDPGSEQSTFRQDTLDTWVKAMELMRDKVGRTSVEYGFAYTFGHVDRIDDMPLGSSHYIFSDETIPFMQIALHGLIPYTAPPSNLRDDQRMEFLRALEYGAQPSYELTYEDPVLLKRTMVDDLFSTKFEDWLDRSVEEYSQIEAVLNQVSNIPIDHHEMLQSGVYRTSYANGLQVIVNYNETAVTAEGLVIKPYGFEVKGGTER